MPATDSKHKSRILDKTAISHDVNRWIVEKPDGYQFVPGQATELALNKEGYRDKPRPFTFTSLAEDPHLEFIIKTYSERDGVTDRMDDLTVGDELLLGEPFGAISYRGPGTFIAGGAGVTPFISIFRQREREGDLHQSRLIFANDRAKDVFMKEELDRLLNGRVQHVLSEEDAPFAERGKVDQAFLEEHGSAFGDQYFYLCGPPGMGASLKADLIELGAESSKIVHEDWSE
jgi:hypothetical protein